MRKRRAVKRDVLADPLYNSKLVTKLINTIMLDGKKGVAQKIVYSAFDMIKEKTNQDAMEVFEKAKKSKVLDKILEIEVKDEIYEELKKLI